MLQGIAGALLGPVTFQGGAATAALGLAMHFGVAFTATAIFYWLSRRFPVMVEWVVPAGLLYGVVWLLVMYRGVIPLTAALRTLYLSNVKRSLPQLVVKVDGDGNEVTGIKDVTPIPHNGCRPPKRRRV